MKNYVENITNNAKSNINNKERRISNFEYMKALNNSTSELENSNRIFPFKTQKIEEEEGSFLKAIDNCIQQLETSSNRKPQKIFNYEKKVKFPFKTHNFRHHSVKFIQRIQRNIIKI